MHSDTPILNAAFMLAVVAAFLVACQALCGCSVALPEAPGSDIVTPGIHTDPKPLPQPTAAQSQPALESGAVACDPTTAPKISFTALGLPTTLTGEQGPPASVCECVGDRYACFSGVVLECKSTIMIDEQIVTPSEAACPGAQWLGHGGPKGLDWVWCCQ